jgi:hypothetical protein
LKTEIFVHIEKQTGTQGGITKGDLLGPNFGLAASFLYTLHVVLWYCACAYSRIRIRWKEPKIKGSKTSPEIALETEIRCKRCTYL